MSEVRDEPPTIVLETSAAIAYLAREPGSRDVEGLLGLAEAGRIRIDMSDFAWLEIDKSRHPADRLKRLSNLAGVIPNVARLGTWRLGLDVLAHDDSYEILDGLSKPASRYDREQFLSYAAQSNASFFVTNDRDFLKTSVKKRVHEKFGFQVGEPKDCIRWLREQGIVYHHKSVAWQHDARP